MLLNRIGQSAIFGDTEFAVGMNVYVKGSDYEGLYGRILEIRDGEHKETENEDPEIECEFFTPKNPSIRLSIEERFTLLYGEPKTIEDLCLDFAIMTPDMLRPMKRCRIYQIKSDNKDFKLIDYETVQASGVISPPTDIYKVVYDAQLDTDNMDDIFLMFNVENERNDTGIILSFSNIVEIYDDNGSEYYFCGLAGFREIELNSGEKQGTDS